MACTCLESNVQREDSNEGGEADSRKASIARMTGWVRSLLTIKIAFGGVSSCRGLSCVADQLVKGRKKRITNVWDRCESKEKDLEQARSGRRGINECLRVHGHNVYEAKFDALAQNILRWRLSGLSI